MRRENAGAGLLVELQHLARGHAQAEPDGDDAAGRGAGDEVEIFIDRLAQPVLDLGEKGRRKDALDAAAIDGEDTPHWEPLAHRDGAPAPPLRESLGANLYLGVNARRPAAMSGCVALDTGPRPFLCSPGEMSG